MFTTIEDFEKRWQYESQVTQSVMDALTDESLGQAVADDHRTLGRMAWHITCATPHIMGHAGLEFSGPDPTSPVPVKAGEIAKEYRKVSQELLQGIRKDWTDSSLLEEDDMFGETWRRGFTLYVLILHEVHHRGQMTVLMRQAGLVVPNIYGMAKEGWAAHGMPEPGI